MPQSLPQQKPETTLNPVADPQILPMSYAMPMLSARFASPAGSAFLAESLVALLLGRKDR